MKEQIKQGKFAIADLSFHIYPDYRGILSLFQVNKPKNIFITGLLPLPEAPNTYRADLYFKDKSIRAIRFTLTFQDRLSGDIDVTGLIQAIRQYSQYPDHKKAYLQGVVVPQIQAISEPPINNTTEVSEPPKTRPETRETRRKTRECKKSTEKLQADFDKNLDKNLENFTKQCLEPQQQAITSQLTDNTQKSQRTLKTTSETTAEAFEDDIEVPQKVLQVLNEFQELNPDEKELFTYFQYNLQEIRNYQEKTTSLDMSKSNDNKKVDI